MSIASVQQWLEGDLVYKPKKIELFQQAFTHRSFSKEHNERLEFLGDAILDMVIGEALYHQLPNVDEGKLSRYRAELVKGESLAEIAKSIELPQFLRLGAGEEKTGGRNRHSNLAGAFEALIGAVYLDSDYQQCQTVILKLFSAALAEIEVTANRKDAKTTLQELMQAEKLSLPEYSLVKIDGEQHKQQFTIELSVAGIKETVKAVGPSKKQAQQLAAEQMLAILAIQS